MAALIPVVAAACGGSPGGPDGGGTPTPEATATGAADTLTTTTAVGTPGEGTGADGADRGPGWPVMFTPTGSLVVWRLEGGRACDGPAPLEVLTPDGGARVLTGGAALVGAGDGAVAWVDRCEPPGSVRWTDPDDPGGVPAASPGPPPVTSLGDLTVLREGIAVVTGDAPGGPAAVVTTEDGWGVLRQPLVGVGEALPAGEGLVALRDGRVVRVVDLAGRDVAVWEAPSATTAPDAGLVVLWGPAAVETARITHPDAPPVPVDPGLEGQEWVASVAVDSAGTTLAFVIRGPDGDRLVVCDPDGGNRRTLARAAAIDRVVVDTGGTVVAWAAEARPDGSRRVTVSGW